MHRIKSALSVVALLALVVSNSAIGADTLARWTWDPPTTGSAAVSYTAVAVTDTTDPGGSQVASAADLPDPEVTLAIPDDVRVFVRVVAKDAQGRFGPWSVFSEPQIFEGPPGACSRPSFTGRQ